MPRVSFLVFFYFDDRSSERELAFHGLSVCQKKDRIETAALIERERERELFCLQVSLDFILYMCVV